MSFLKKIFGKKDNPEQKQTPQKEITLNDFKEIPWMTETRLQSISTCLEAGFKPAKSLPTEFDRQLRPTIEIAKRLHAIKVLVLWLMVPEEHLPTEIILNFININNLKDFMTEDEIVILDAARDDEDLRNMIGWKFENTWPLAWFFGYETPEISGEMMSGERMQDILVNHTCGLDTPLEEWIKERTTITEKELIQKEDLFYCLHNAVRSAQLGGNTVPEGFNPMANGGVIHERRHALTWMLSKEISWEDTDLST